MNNLVFYCLRVFPGEGARVQKEGCLEELGLVPPWKFTVWVDLESVQTRDLDYQHIVKVDFLTS